MNERIAGIYSKWADRFSDLEVKGRTLYIVSTPIGNLEDISFRAIQILKKVDLIACEDTRNTNFLLSQYGIKNKTISYYSNVETAKLDFFLSQLRDGKSVALASDAGTPSISDPGNILISNCINEGIDIVPVPGCSALIHALVVSGFPINRFFFQGFLPLKKGRQTLLNDLKDVRMPVIIFESPFRIYKTLNEIFGIFGNRDVSVSRELTKKFEETIRGKLKSILTQNLKTKGEFVIIINKSTN